MSHARESGPVGMVVFLASWAMLLFALAYAAAALRSRGAWAPLAEATGIGLPLLATALALASSLVLAATRRTGAAAAIGAAFLAAQISLWWRADGAGDGARSVLYLLSGFHALHAAVGVAALTILAARRRQPGLWAVYWHAVAAAWLIIAALLYL